MRTSTRSRYGVGDLTKCDPRDLRQMISECGLATFECLPDEMQQVLARVASELGTIHVHPHGEANGTTRISPQARNDHATSIAGFSNQHLSPHTDASAIEMPPAFLLNGCVSSAARGGTTLLTDMRLVYEDLQARDPAALEKFCHLGSAVFGQGETAQFASIFLKIDNRMMVRFRMDERGYVPATHVELFCTLRRAIVRKTIYIDLRPGEGYILDNHWWLHGRTAFEGDREILRVLAHRKSDDTYETGFPLKNSRTLTQQTGTAGDSSHEVFELSF